MKFQYFRISGGINGVKSQFGNSKVIFYYYWGRTLEADR